MGGMRKLKRKSRNSEHKVEPLRSEKSFLDRKMSEVIQDFAEPLLDIFDDDRYFKTVIGFAAICWDLSFYPEQEQQKQLRSLVNEMVRSTHLPRLEIEGCARMLIERKKAFFADDRRMIVNYGIVEGKDRHRLLVMSTLVKD